MKNIVLIGFMGSGKSTVGRAVACKLGIEFIDMDVTIEYEQGMQIRQIFADYGESYFRDLEYKLFDKLCLNKTNTVISTGGGAVTTIKNFKQLGFVIYLKINFQDLLERLKDDEFDKRPLFQDIEFAKKLYEYREPLYAKQADIVIDAMQNTNDIVNTIIAKCF